MTDAEKNLIDHCRQQGKGCTEIARLLNLSVNTVKSYLRRNRTETAPGAVPQEEQPRVPGADNGCCLQCGAVLLKKPHRRAKRFCSDACRLAWWHAHREDAANAGARTCPACGKIFVTDRDQKYCSHACYIAQRFGRMETK